MRIRSPRRTIQSSDRVRPHPTTVLLVADLEGYAARHVGPDDDRPLDPHRVRPESHPGVARLRLRVASDRQRVGLPFLGRQRLKRMLSCDTGEDAVVHQPIEMLLVSFGRTDGRTPFPAEDEDMADYRRPAVAVQRRAHLSGRADHLVRPDRKEQSRGSPHSAVHLRLHRLGAAAVHNGERRHPPLPPHRAAPLPAQ